VTSSDTITAAQWRDLQMRAWKYQLGNRRSNDRFRVVHRLDKAHTN